MDHRFKNDLDVFLRVAESLLPIKYGGDCCVDALSWWRQLIQPDADFFDPLTVGLGLGQRVFQLHVINDATLFEIDQEHLARLQTPFFDDLLVRDRQNTRFGSHHDEIIVSNQITGRTQTITIKRGTDLTTVGEGNCSRAVPRLHHRRVILVEGATIFVHLRMLFPGFRDHQHDSLGQRIAAHDQQLKRVVEGG